MMPLASAEAAGWPTPPVTGPGDGGECVLTHHTNSGVQADANSFYNISDHTNPNTLTKIGPWNVPSGTVEGLTANVAGEVFYALNANRGGKLWLGELDTGSGSFSDITTAGSATISHSTYGSLSIHQSRAIAHQPGTNELWVAAYDTQPTSGPGATYVYLFKISSATGEVLTGAFAGEDYMAIDLAPYTFNSSNDRPSVEALTFYKNEPDILYGVLSTLSGGTPKVGHLFAVDVSQASPQAVLAPNNLSGVAYSGGAAPSSDHYDIEGMSFDQNGDLVIVSSNIGGTNANSLFTVDLATGTASNKRSIISGDWEGIVCDPFLRGKDYGDAPISGTAPDGSSSITYGQAAHIVVSGTYLGSADPDVDVANQPGTNADGDDSNGTDDEDGVVMPNLIQGYTSTLSATVSGSGGYLQGWIDFDGNGAFDAGEQIATNLQDGGAGDADGLSNGSISFDVATPSGATTNLTYARFRWSTTSGLDATTVASDGEVEDYALTITTPAANFSCSSKVDLWFANDESGSVSATEFIDARDFIYLVSDEFYHSFADGAQGGLVGWAYSAAPKNVIMPLTETFYDQGDTGLASTGTTVDGDGNGVRENYTAKIDTTGGTHLSNATQGVADLVNAGNGRRTGVPQVAVFLTDAPSSQINNVSGNGGGTAWEAAAANLRNAGPDGVRIAVVLLAEAADAYDNNAASKATIDSVIGNDGIVIKTSSYALAADPAESYIQQTVDQICGVASFVEYDFGDAPVSGVAANGTDSNNYGETSHLITNGVYLGGGEPDADAANQPDMNAEGDDGDGSDDEDGIVIPVLTQGETSSIVATVVGSGGYLQGWIDFDGNGTFDAGEQVATDLQEGGAGDTDGSGNGTITFDVNVPMTAVTSQTYARFRWSTTQGLDSTTAALDGEVEDYALTIELGGFPVKGRVFIDTNVDAVNDAGEKGVSDLPVVLIKVESNPANNTCVSVRTDAEGNYEFFPVLPGNYQLYEASRETVPTPQNCDIAKAKDPASYRSTTDNVLAQFSVIDAEITGKDFGDVKGPTFEPDNAGSVLPGNVTFYPHQFTPNSTGTVSFTVNDSGAVTSGWSSTLYQDTNCNGQLDGAEVNAPVGTNLTSTAGTSICLINKVYAPANVSAGENYINVITANFTFGNPANVIAGTSTLKVTDLTKVSVDSQGASRLELKKTVQTYRGMPLSAVSAETETQNEALPGDVLKYRIYYSNTGNAPLTDLLIKDVIPEFTTLNSAPVCESPLPASLTSCTPAVSGQNLEWVFPANDELKAGNGGIVSYEVIIDQFHRQQIDLQYGVSQSKKRDFMSRFFMPENYSL